MQHDATETDGSKAEANQTLGVFGALAGVGFKVGVLGGNGRGQQGRFFDGKNFGLSVGEWNFQRQAFSGMLKLHRRIQEILPSAGSSIRIREYFTMLDLTGYSLRDFSWASTSK
jgi:hypothetical protein